MAWEVTVFRTSLAIIALLACMPLSAQAAGGLKNWRRFLPKKASAVEPASWNFTGRVKPLDPRAAEKKNPALRRALKNVRRAYASVVNEQAKLNGFGPTAIQRYLGFTAIEPRYSGLGKLQGYRVQAVFDPSAMLALADSFDVDRHGNLEQPLFGGLFDTNRTGLRPLAIQRARDKDAASKHPADRFSRHQATERILTRDEAEQVRAFRYATKRLSLVFRRVEAIAKSRSKRKMENRPEATIEFHGRRAHYTPDGTLSHFTLEVTMRSPHFTFGPVVQTVVLAPDGRLQRPLFDPSTGVFSGSHIGLSDDVRAAAIAELGN